MTEVKCPGCNGGGCLRGLLCGADGHEPRMVEVGCAVCSGKGRIPEDRFKRWEEGRRKREERLALGLSLREAAHLRGISPVELSAQEQGIS